MKQHFSRQWITGNKGHDTQEMENKWDEPYSHPAHRLESFQATAQGDEACTSPSGIPDSWGSAEMEMARVHRVPERRKLHSERMWTSAKGSLHVFTSPGERMHRRTFPEARTGLVPTSQAEDLTTQRACIEYPEGFVSIVRNNEWLWSPLANFKSKTWEDQTVLKYHNYILEQTLIIFIEI